MSASDSFVGVLQLSPISAADEWLAHGTVSAIEAWTDSQLAIAQTRNVKSDLLATKAYCRWVSDDRAAAKSFVAKAVAASSDNPRSQLFAAWILSNESLASLTDVIRDDSKWCEHARLIQASGLVDAGKYAEAKILVGKVNGTLPYALLLKAYFAAQGGKAGDQLSYADEYLRMRKLGTLSQRYVPYYLKSNALIEL
ncbi:MAG: hypothetical protein ACTHK7_07230, partial [Aureliella sp.]